jgi:hypothetical protein
MEKFEICVGVDGYLYYTIETDTKDEAERQAFLRARLKDLKNLRDVELRVVEIN